MSDLEKMSCGTEEFHAVNSSVHQRGAERRGTAAKLTGGFTQLADYACNLLDMMFVLTKIDLI